MLFEPSFAAHGAIRSACAERSLAIVLFSPHLDAVFDIDKGAGDRLQRALADLAAASGRAEIATALLMPYGHSVGSVFASRVLFWKPERCFAGLTFKGGLGIPEDIGPARIAGIPLLHVQGQFEEFGPGPNGVLRADEDRSTGGRTAMAQLSAHRAREPRLLLSLLVEEGGTHYALSDRVAERISAFIRAAADRRLPAEGAAASTLVDVDPATGALSGADVFAPEAPAAPAASWTGDRARSFWHCDVELAKAADAFHAGAAARRPQFVAFADAKGKPVDVGHDMRLKLAPRWTGPGVFTVAGAFCSSVPTKYPPVDGPVGHADGPVRFRVFGGPIEQIGDAAFRVTMDGRQGGPGRSFVLAYHPGDATWRYAEQPARVSCPERLTRGSPQRIAFAELGERAAAELPLALAATSDAGLPVGFHVDRGPARVRDGRLELAEVPATATWPLEIAVVAWQYGSAIAPEVQSAEPVRRLLRVTR